MKLASWNVNVLRAVCKKGFLDFFKSSGVDVLCLQETKCQLDQVPPECAAPAGYTTQYHCAVKKGYSGVATFSKLPPLRVDRGFDIPRLDGEGRVLTYVYPFFTLFNIYFPNGKMSPERLAFKMDFYDSFLKVIEK